MFASQACVQIPVTGGGFFKVVALVRYFSDECRVKLQRMRGFCDVGGFLIFLLARLEKRPIFAPQPPLTAGTLAGTAGFAC